MENIGIDILIINYFSVNKILPLLESIDKSEYDKELINTIIVSNSQEDELQLLENKTSVYLIKNEKNMGFGFACNQSLLYCKHPYLLLLNPDTLVKKDTLQKSVNYINEYRSITVLGIKHLDTHGNVAASCSRFPSLKNHIYKITGLSAIMPHVFNSASLMSDFDHLTSKYVNQVMGAYMLIRKSYIDEYGFMDTRFFVFGEDMDFCKRVWLNKEKVYYNATIEIIHEGGSSSNNIGGKKLCYMLEGKLKYAHKYFTKAEWFVLLLMVLCIEPIMRVLWSLVTLNFKKIAETAEGYYLFLKRRQFQ